jgi:hypothetical protein
MNKYKLVVSLSTLLGSAVVALGAKIDTKCQEPADATHKSVTAKPEAVLEIVAKDVAASPKCACPIVKAAINASQASEELTGDIVVAAINAAPDEAAALKACVAPKASGKGMVVGKNPVKGKDPVATVPTAQTEEPKVEDGWFDPLIFGAGGMGVGANGAVYTSTPGSGAGGPGGSNIDNVPDQIIQVIEVPVRRPRVVVNPSTRSR